MLDSPEGIRAGQAGFEYPATSVPFSIYLSSQSEVTVIGSKSLVTTLMPGHPDFDEPGMKTCQESGNARRPGAVKGS